MKIRIFSAGAIGGVHAACLAQVDGRERQCHRSGRSKYLDVMLPIMASKARMVAAGSDNDVHMPSTESDHGRRPAKRAI
jgi:hypothetical protein